MTHKRYVIKNGKFYGPYLYESYRDKDGNVKKRYLGRHRDIKRGNLPITFIAILLSLMLFSLFMLFKLLLQKFF